MLMGLLYITSLGPVQSEQWCISFLWILGTCGHLRRREAERPPATLVLADGFVGHADAGSIEQHGIELAASMAAVIGSSCYDSPRERV